MTRTQQMKQLHVIQYTWTQTVKEQHFAVDVEKQVIEVRVLKCFQSTYSPRSIL